MFHRLRRYDVSLEGLFFLMTATTLASVPPVSAWRHCTRAPVSDVPDRHTVHAYFNTCPESPDGKTVLFYASTAASGETGSLVLKDRTTGAEETIAENLETEDAHRVACQQWMQGGRTVVYHDHKDGVWTVYAYDVATKTTRALASGRQLGFASPDGRGTLVPLYGYHWNPTDHRDLEVYDLENDRIRTVVRVDDALASVRASAPGWVEKTFPEADRPMSVFFPVMSPGDKHVFFKLSQGNGGANFKSSAASRREGKLVYEVSTGRLLRFLPLWGHPSWSPDGSEILEKGNVTFNALAKGGRRLTRFSTDHPSFGPDGTLFVSDGKATKADYAVTGKLVVTVGDAVEKDGESVRVDYFYSKNGAKSWRASHPHPVFNHDGTRLYYNVCEDGWTRLRVAEVDPSAPETPAEILSDLPEFPGDSTCARVALRVY